MLLAARICARRNPQGNLDDITRLKFEVFVRDQIFAANGAVSDNCYRGLAAESAREL
jgi:hypothetical protein